MKKENLLNLTEEEKQLALSILNEVKTGNNQLYNELKYSDYKEIPVDIETFIHDKRYLGQSLYDAEGRFTVFKYWEEKLKEIFPTNTSIAYNTLIITGSIGTGKSFVSVICLLYLLYRMMCLKDPYVFYGLQPIDKITFSFINITLDAAKGVAWSKCQELVQNSPWFMEHGSLNMSNNPVWSPEGNIELIYGSMNRHIIGRAVFCSMEDEVNFLGIQDVEKAKTKMKGLVSSVDARMQSRFMKGSYKPTLNIIVSSKASDQSFLDDYIETKKRNESKTTLIIDEPQWVVRNDKDSDIKFPVAVGNKFLESTLLSKNWTDEEVETYRNRGYSILWVPNGYYENFADDLQVALTDIAGISTTNAMNYISGERWALCIDSTHKNPFNKEIITVGNGKDDESQYYDYFDLSCINKDDMSKPLYIHLDQSISGDKTGIGGVWVVGKKPGIDESGKDLIYKLAFCTSVKAPKGAQISFEKTRNFVRWLRQQGFNIKGVSSDTFQAYDTLQQLKAEGFNTDIISVDRVQDRVCRPYLTFKNAIYEGRIIAFKNTLLSEEIIGLKRDSNGKVDHSSSGINCFTGDTLVRMLDGKAKNFIDLLNDYENNILNYVYTFNETTKCIEPKLIKKVWCSGEVSTLLEVTLDNNEKVMCTPEHRFMTRDSRYKEAKDLISGESIMPLYTKYPNNKSNLIGYRLFYSPFEDKWQYEHRQFAESILDKKYLVHHIDCNKFNNRPDNLLWMSKESHTKIHAELQTGAQSTSAREKRRKSIKASHLKAKNSETGWMRYYHGNINDKIAHHNKIIKEKNDKKLRVEAINNLFNINYDDLSSSEKNKYQNKYKKYLKNNEVDLSIDFRSKKQKLKDKQLFHEFLCKYYDKNINELSSNDLQSLALKYKFENDADYKEHIRQNVIQNHKNGKYKNAIIALSNRIWYTNGANNIYIKSNEEVPAGYYKGRVISESTKNKLRNHEVSEETKHKLSSATSRKRWYKNIELGKSIYIDVDEIPPAGYVPGRLLNHKIQSIKYIYLDEPVKVYDMEIEDNHNFALDIGIFVHNSKDASDSICGSIWNASQHAEEYAYEYGETYSSMFEINKTDLNPYQQFGMQLENQLKEQHVSSEYRKAIIGTNNLELKMPDVFGGNGMLVW